MLSNTVFEAVLWCKAGSFNVPVALPMDNPKPMEE
jgi:hypothetical protein